VVAAGSRDHLGTAGGGTGDLGVGPGLEHVVVDHAAVGVIDQHPDDGPSGQ
jgi:hypothetical protein